MGAVYRASVEQLKTDVGGLRADSRVVKTAVTDQSKHLVDQELKNLITRLENAA